MRISHKYKFVFIAVPRTGSTSVRNALNAVSDVESVLKYQITENNPFYHHISASEIREIFKQRDWKWEEYHKFCVVRNPYDRAVSLYHHRIDTKDREAPKKSGVYNFVRNLKYKYFYNKTFSDWLSKNNFEKGLSRSVKSFTHDTDGNCLVDTFIKFENIDDEFKQLSKTLGFNEKVDYVERKNQTIMRDEYRSYYEVNTKEIIENKYSYELNLFDYKF